MNPARHTDVPARAEGCQVELEQRILLRYASIHQESELNIVRSFEHVPSCMVHGRGLILQVAHKMCFIQVYWSASLQNLLARSRVRSFQPASVTSPATASTVSRAASKSTPNILKPSHTGSLRERMCILSLAASNAT